tara:strand:+ start:1541 stop:2125 length:585 start_codon:yes stop_codon:yes gene_type:complete
MSLAMYAAPFDNNEIKEENIVEKKRIKHHKSLKKKERNIENKKKIDESMLSQIGKIHANIDSEEGNDLSDFNPIARPESQGVNRTMRDQYETSDNNEEDEVEEYDSLDSSYAQQYYSKFLPGTIENMESGNLSTANMPLNENLVEKINYMIHLLEESQEQKTEHVVEEMLLYLGLGVFVIYVLDSFVKIGKYQK